MALQRVPHWPTRAFDGFLVERAPVPFAWGTNDCLLFAADGVLAICDGRPGDAIDPAAKFRGRYIDAHGAMATTQAVTGSADMLQATEFVAASVGMKKRENPRMAGRGDVVLVEDAGRLICGLVGLSGRWVHAPGDSGMRKICILQVRHAWTY